jgi:hypothetical protein
LYVVCVLFAAGRWPSDEFCRLGASGQTDATVSQDGRRPEHPGRRPAPYHNISPPYTETEWTKVALNGDQ